MAFSEGVTTEISVTLKMSVANEGDENASWVKNQLHHLKWKTHIWCSGYDGKRWECCCESNGPTEAYNATADIWSLGITCIEMVWMPRIDLGHSGTSFSSAKSGFLCMCEVQALVYICNMIPAFEWVPTFLRMWWATPLQKRLYLFNLFQPAVRQTASRLTITFHPPGPCLWLAPSRPQATREIFGLEKRHPEFQALHVLS